MGCVPLAVATAQPARRSAGDRAVLILHGLFGSSRNWRTVATSLADTLGREVHSADLRNHGQTYRQQGARPMTWPLLAEDLGALLGRLGPRRISLVGHSLGGQVCMQAQLLQCPAVQARVDRMVIVDVAPRALSFRGSQVARLLDRMLLLNAAGLASRRAAHDFLRATEPDEAVVQFLLSNLRATGGAYTIDLPLDALRTGMQHLQDTYTQCRVAPAVHTPSLFLQGTRSDYVSDADLPELRRLFPAAEVTAMDTGHWPHAEQPVGFVAHVSRFLA